MVLFEVVGSIFGFILTGVGVGLVLVAFLAVLLLALSSTPHPTHLASDGPDTAALIDDTEDGSVHGVGEVDGAAFLRSSGGAETCRWLNAIVRRALQQFVLRAQTQENIRRFIAQQLTAEKLSLPDVVGPIRLKSLKLGSAVPIVKAIAVREIPTTKDFELLCDVRYKGVGSELCVATSVCLNWPTPRCIVLPVEVTLQNIMFAVKLKVVYSHPAQPEAAAATAADGDWAAIRVALLEQPRYDMLFSTQIGRGRVLHNPPKLTSLINHKLRQIIAEMLASQSVYSAVFDLRSVLKFPFVDQIPNVDPNRLQRSGRKYRQRSAADDSESDDDSFWSDSEEADEYDNNNDAEVDVDADADDSSAFYDADSFTGNDTVHSSSSASIGSSAANRLLRQRLNNRSRTHKSPFTPASATAAATPQKLRK